MQGKQGKNAAVGAYPQAAPPAGPPADPHAAYLQYTDISKIMGLHLPEHQRPHESTYASLKPYYQTDEDGVSKYHKIMAAAGYYVHPSKLNPFPDPSSHQAGVASGPTGLPTQPQQVPSSSVQQGEAAASASSPSQLAAQQLPSSSSSLSQSDSRLNPNASPFPGVPTFADHAAYSPSSSQQQQAAGARLNPNASPYYPPMAAMGGASAPAPYPLGSPYHQQQATMQLMQSSQGLPNPISQHVGQQSGWGSVGYPTTAARPASVSAQYAQQNGVSADPGSQAGSNRLYSQLGYNSHSASRRGGHRQHLAEKLHLPMDWHMDVAAGKAPATFSPLGDQATSGYFPPILTPDSAMHTLEYMANVTQPQRLSPDPSPKRYAQHALRVSAEALSQAPNSQGGQPQPHAQQMPPSLPSPSHRYQFSENPGMPPYGYGQAVSAGVTHHPAEGGHRPQSPSVIVHQVENPGMASYLSQHPGQPTQSPAYPGQSFAGPTWGPGYPSQGSGKPNQGSVYPSQLSGYPAQRPGHPYQGAGFSIRPLRPSGQVATPSQAAAGFPYPDHASAEGVMHPPQAPPGFAGYPQQTPGPAPVPDQGSIMAVHPGMAAYPSQSRLFSSQLSQGTAAAAAYPSQSVLTHYPQQQQQGMGGGAYASQQSAMGAYPGQASPAPLQGQGSGSAFGGFVGDPFIGSNGKPRISGMMSQLDQCWSPCTLSSMDSIS